MILYDGYGDMMQSQCKTVVCTTNVAGAMGKGLAKMFRDSVPGLYTFYRERFPRDDTPDPEKMRELYVYPINDRQQVLLLPTKLHWRNPSTYSMIHDGLQEVIRQWDMLELESVAFPALGCQNGGLQFRVVRSILHRYFRDSQLPIEIYHPY